MAMITLDTGLDTVGQPIGQTLAAHDGGITVSLDLATAVLEAAAAWDDFDGPRGWIYLLHFDRAYRHAKHYTGFAVDLDRRLTAHLCGRGARLTTVVAQAGIGWTLARVWPGTRSMERALKNQGGASRRCPMCWATRSTTTNAAGGS